LVIQSIEERQPLKPTSVNQATKDYLNKKKGTEKFKMFIKKQQQQQQP
jgi:hypothetical protein